MNSGFSQLQELAVPLAIAGLIVLFAALTFGVWSRRIQHARQAVRKLDVWLAQAPGSGHDAILDASTRTPDSALAFLLRET